MASPETTATVYEEVAGYYDRQGEAPMRDRFLVLAAEAALTAGQSTDAERLRGRLLQLNPHHILKPYATLPEALKSSDVSSYINGLKRSYPLPRAEQLRFEFRASGPPLVSPRVAPPPTFTIAEGTLNTLLPHSEPEASPARNMPPSKILDMDEAFPPLSPPATNPPVLKVYRLKEPDASAKPPTPTPALAKPELKPALPAKPKKSVVVKPRSGPLAGKADLSAAFATSVVTHDEVVEFPPGSWVPFVLFVLLLVAQTVLLLYTVGRPFWEV